MADALGNMPPDPGGPNRRRRVRFEDEVEQSVFDVYGMTMEKLISELNVCHDTIEEGRAILRRLYERLRFGEDRLRRISPDGMSQESEASRLFREVQRLKQVLLNVVQQREHYLRQLIQAQDILCDDRIQMDNFLRIARDSNRSLREKLRTFNEITLETNSLVSDLRVDNELLWRILAEIENQMVNEIEEVDKHLAWLTNGRQTVDIQDSTVKRSGARANLSESRDSPSHVGESSRQYTARRPTLEGFESTRYERKTSLDRRHIPRYDFDSRETGIARPRENGLSRTRNDFDLRRSHQSKIKSYGDTFTSDTFVPRYDLSSLRRRPISRTGDFENSVRQTNEEMPPATTSSSSDASDRDRIHETFSHGDTIGRRPVYPFRTAARGSYDTHDVTTPSPGSEDDGSDTSSLSKKLRRLVEQSENVQRLISDVSGKAAPRETEISDSSRASVEQRFHTEPSIAEVDHIEPEREHVTSHPDQTDISSILKRCERLEEKMQACSPRTVREHLLGELEQLDNKKDSEKKSSQSKSTTRIANHSLYFSAMNHERIRRNLLDCLDKIFNLERSFGSAEEEIRQLKIDLSHALKEKELTERTSKSEVDELKTKLAIRDRHIEALTEELRKAREELAETKKVPAAEERPHQEKKDHIDLTAETQTLKEKVETKSKEVDKLKEALNEAIERMERLKNHEYSNAELRTEVKRFKVELTRLQKENVALTQAGEENMVDELFALQKVIEEAEKKFQGIMQESMQLKDTLKTEKGKTDGMQEENADLRRERKQLVEKINDLENTVRELEENFEGKRNDFEAELNLKDADADYIRQQAQNLEEENSELKERMNEMESDFKATLDDKNAELRKLELKLQKYQDILSQEGDEMNKKLDSMYEDFMNALEESEQEKERLRLGIEKQKNVYDSLLSKKEDETDFLEARLSEMEQDTGGNKLSESEVFEKLLGEMDENELLEALRMNGFNLVKGKVAKDAQTQIRGLQKDLNRLKERNEDLTEENERLKRKVMDESETELLEKLLDNFSEKELLEILKSKDFDFERPQVVRDTQEQNLSLKRENKRLKDRTEGLVAEIRQLKSEVTKESDMELLERLLSKFREEDLLEMLKMNGFDFEKAHAIENAQAKNRRLEKENKRLTERVEDLMRDIKRLKSKVNEESGTESVEKFLESADDNDLLERLLSKFSEDELLEMLKMNGFDFEKSHAIENAQAKNRRLEKENNRLKERVDDLVREIKRLRSEVNDESGMESLEKLFQSVDDDDLLGRLLSKFSEDELLEILKMKGFGFEKLHVVEDAQTKNRRLEKENSKLKEKLEELMEEIKRLKSKENEESAIVLLEKLLQGVNDDDLLEMLRQNGFDFEKSQTVKDAQMQNRNLDRENRRLKERNEGLQEENKRLKLKMNEGRVKKKTDTEGLEREIEELQEKVLIKELENEKLSDELEEIKENIKGYEEELSGLNEELKSMGEAKRKIIEDAKRNKVELQKAVKLEEEKLREIVSEARGNIDGLQDQKSALEQQIKDYQQKLKSLAQENEKLEKELGRLKGEEVIRKSDAPSWESENDKLKDEIQRLRAKFAEVVSSRELDGAKIERPYLLSEDSISPDEIDSGLSRSDKNKLIKKLQMENQSLLGRLSKLEDETTAITKIVADMERGHGHVTGLLRGHLILQTPTTAKLLENSLQQFSDEYDKLKEKFVAVEQKYDQEQTFSGRRTFAWDLFTNAAATLINIQSILEEGLIKVEGDLERDFSSDEDFEARDYKSRLWILRRRLSDVEHRYRELQLRAGELNIRLDAKTTEFDVTQDELEDATKHIETTEAELSKLKKDSQTLAEENQELRKLLDQIKENQDAAINAIIEENQDLKKRFAEFVEDKAAVGRLTRELDILRNKLVKAENDLEYERKKAIDLRSETEERRKRIAELEELLKKAESERNLLRKHLEKYRAGRQTDVHEHHGTLHMLRDDLKRYWNENVKLKEELQQKQKEINELMKALREANIEIKPRIAAKESGPSFVSDSSKEVAALKKRVKSLEAEKQRLETALKKKDSQKGIQEDTISKASEGKMESVPGEKSEDTEIADQTEQRQEIEFRDNIIKDLEKKIRELRKELKAAENKSAISAGALKKTDKEDVSMKGRQRTSLNLDNVDILRSDLAMLKKENEKLQQKVRVLESEDSLDKELVESTEVIKDQHLKLNEIENELERERKKAYYLERQYSDILQRLDGDTDIKQKEFVLVEGSGDRDKSLIKELGKFEKLLKEREKKLKELEQEKEKNKKELEKRRALPESPLDARATRKFTTLDENSILRGDLEYLRRDRERLQEKTKQQEFELESEIDQQLHGATEIMEDQRQRLNDVEEDLERERKKTLYLQKQYNLILGKVGSERDAKKKEIVLIEGDSQGDETVLKHMEDLKATVKKQQAQIRKLQLEKAECEKTLEAFRTHSKSPTVRPLDEEGFKAMYLTQQESEKSSPDGDLESLKISDLDLSRDEDDSPVKEMLMVPDQWQGDVEAQVGLSGFPGEDGRREGRGTQASQRRTAPGGRGLSPVRLPSRIPISPRRPASPRRALSKQEPLGKRDKTRKAVEDETGTTKAETEGLLLKIQEQDDDIRTLLESVEHFEKEAVKLKADLNEARKLEKKRKTENETLMKDSSVIKDKLAKQNEMEKKLLGMKDENKKLVNNLREAETKLRRLTTDNRKLGDVSNESKILQSKLQEAQNELQDLRKENDILQKRVDEKLEHESERLSSEDEHKQETNFANQTQIISRQNEEIMTLKDQIKALSQEIASKGNELESKDKEIISMKEELVRLKDALKDIENGKQVLDRNLEASLSEVNSLSEENSIMKEMITEFEKTLEEKNNEIASLIMQKENDSSDAEQTIVKELETEREKLEQEIDEMKEKLQHQEMKALTTAEELKAYQTIFEKEIENLKETLKEKELEIAALQEETKEVNILKESNNFLKLEVGDLQEKLLEFENATSESPRLNDDNEQLSEQINELQKQLTEKELQLLAITEELNSELNSDGENLKAVLAEKEAEIDALNKQLRIREISMPAIPEEVEPDQRDLKLYMENLQATLEEKEKEISTLNQKLGSKEVQLLAVQEKLEESQKSFIIDVETLEASLAEKETEIIALDEQLQELRNKEIQLSALTGESGDLKNLETYVAEREAEIDELKRQLGYKDLEVHSITEKFEAEQDEINLELTNVREVVAEKEKEILRLTEELQSRESDEEIGHKLLVDQVGKLKQELENCKQKLKGAEEERFKSQESTQRLTSQIKMLESQLSSRETQISELMQRAIDAEEEIEQLQENLAMAEEQTVGVTEEQKGGKLDAQEREEFETQIHKKEQYINKLKSDVRNLKETNQELEKQFEELKLDRKSDVKDKSQLENEINVLGKQVEAVRYEFESKVSDLQSRLSVKNKEKTDLELELTKLEIENKELKDSMDGLVSSRSSSEDETDSVKSLEKSSVYKSRLKSAYRELKQKSTEIATLRTILEHKSVASQSVDQGTQDSEGLSDKDLTIHMLQEEQKLKASESENLRSQIDILKSTIQGEDETDRSSKTEAMEMELSELRLKLGESEAACEQLRSDLVTAQLTDDPTEVEELRQQVTMLRNELTEEKQRNKSSTESMLQEEHKLKAYELEDLRSQIEMLKGTIQGEDGADGNAKIEAMQVELSELRLKLNESEAACEQLRSDLITAQLAYDPTEVEELRQQVAMLRNQLTEEKKRAESNSESMLQAEQKLKSSGSEDLLSQIEILTGTIQKEDEADGNAKTDAIKMELSELRLKLNESEAACEQLRSDLITAQLANDPTEVEDLRQQVTILRNQLTEEGKKAESSTERMLQEEQKLKFSESGDLLSQIEILTGTIQKEDEADGNTKTEAMKAELSELKLKLSESEAACEQLRSDLITARLANDPTEVEDLRQQVTVLRNQLTEEEKKAESSTERMLQEEQKLKFSESGDLLSQIGIFTGTIQKEDEADGKVKTDAMKVELSELRLKLNESEAACEQLRSDLITAQLANDPTEVVELRRQVSLLGTQLSEKEKANIETDALRIQLSELTAKLSESETTCERLRDDLRTAQLMVDETEMETLRNQVTILRDRLIEKEESYNSLKNKLSQSDSDRGISDEDDLSDRDVNELKKEITDRGKKIETLNFELEELEEKYMNEMNYASSHISELMLKIEESEQTMKGIKLKMETLEKNKDELENRNLNYEADVKVLLDKLKQANEEIEKKNSMVSNMKESLASFYDSGTSQSGMYSFFYA